MGRSCKIGTKIFIVTPMKILIKNSTNPCLKYTNLDKTIKIKLITSENIIVIVPILIPLKMDSEIKKVSNALKPIAALI